MTWIMLTVDLNHDVTRAQRERFAESMAQQKWVKLSLTTTWATELPAPVFGNEAIDAAKVEVDTAARNAGIANYEVAALAGPNPPETWNLD